jgi:hypothetical protein
VSIISMAAAFQLCRQWIVIGVVLASFAVPAGAAGAPTPPSAAARCPLTQSEFGDPGYKPNTPIRPHVGTGFVLGGVVRSGIDCSVIPRARVEFWLAGPNGYDDVHRGTVLTDATGRYRFESNFPSGSFGRQPHIHVRIAVPGFRTLTTAFFPQAGSAAGTFDIVLEPEV